MISSISERQKRAARDAFYGQIRYGKLSRQPCEVCGKSNDIEAHHEDYSKPLEIKWLCVPCHKLVHRKTVCKHGHNLTPDNIYVPPKYPNRRACRQCRAERCRQVEETRKRFG